MSAISTESFMRFLNTHRSIRRYKPDPIDPSLIDTILETSIRGSSSSGNLTTYSMVLTRDEARKRRLYEFHFEQEMVLQAPLVITFCADTWRTRRWLRLRKARDNFNNFEGFLVAAFDAMILSQSVALAFEAHGYGICYMGTTLWSAIEIAEFLHLPETVVPVTSMVVGVPDEDPVKRDRLPLRAYVHDEVYQDPSDERLLDLYRDREIKGWERYRSMGEDVIAEMDRLGITNLAQYYTSDIKYSPEHSLETSRKLWRLLQEKRFATGIDSAPSD
ncbi:MAG: NADPH-dependent oxidoreductase [Candidatus Zixiibacteriota bacterium]